MLRQNLFSKLRHQLRSLDNRKRKYLTTHAILSVRSILPKKFRQKMQRRLEKYGPTSRPKDQRLLHTARIDALASDIRRLSFEVRD